MTRFQARLGSGRYQRNTLENTFGLRTEVCPTCHGFNPHGTGEAPPARCCQCGASMDQPPTSPSTPPSVPEPHAADRPHKPHKRTVSPAQCPGCGATIARCLARRNGWTPRGPQQARTWYCPQCPPPPLPMPPPAEAPRAPGPDVRPTDPFAALRWDRDHALQPAPAPSFSIVEMLRKLQ